MGLKDKRLNKLVSHSKVVNFPFKNLIIENFLPSDFLQKLISDVKSLEMTSPTKLFQSEYGLKEEWRKFPKHLSHLAAWMNYLSSNELIRTLGEKFGLVNPDKMTSDDSYDGGGYSITPPGSYLADHADFNFSLQAKRYRVMNLLFYLNENYDDSLGGHLNLLHSVSKTVEVTVSPRLNTMVAFLTDDISFHGVSRTASDFSRRSFNIYYYSDSPLSANQSLEPHKTIWIR